MFKRIQSIWSLLSRSIYTGERLKENLLALTIVSYFTCGLGLVLMAFNVFARDPVMFIASLMTLLGGISCAYFAKVQRNRERAALVPTFFCIIAFTIYTINGLGEGTAMLWALMAPLGLCYFASVRNGILVSIYYSLFFAILFYTPLRSHVEPFYSDAFIMRFPLLYITMSGFTAISMIQYHRGVLLENEYTSRLNEEVARQTEVAEARAKKIEEMSFQTIQTLANAIDAKDPYTKGHSTRVSQYSVLIAQKLGWESDRISDLRYAALLHDIGKIGVPDSILNSPKRLTDVEYSIIKSHTTMGSDILRGKILIASAEDVARHHHERYDGRGYPAGLKGEEISEESRIVAIADAFDAMSSNRVYRRACDPAHIAQEIKNGRGKQFDPHYADLFMELWESGQLDPILQDQSSDEERGVEASSALLKEVMDAFLTQGTEEIDITTGLASRTTGEPAIARRMREHAGCFVFLDMDNLKVINDTNGHEAGDRALHLVGEAILKHNGEGLNCRLGGDEFLLFMEGVTQEEALERMRAIFEDFKRGKEKIVGIDAATLSAGMVMSSPAQSYLQVYHDADKALYHVKQNGKDGFSFYSFSADPMEIDQLDLNMLVKGLHNSGTYDGALNVEYRQFSKLYEYIRNLEKRFSHPFWLVMINLSAPDGELSSLEELEKAMYYMEQSIRQTIRGVDVLTRYSHQRFLIILIGSTPEGVNIAVERIFRGYYKMNGNSIFSPSYSVVTMNPQEEEG